MAKLWLCSLVSGKCYCNNGLFVKFFVLLSAWSDLSEGFLVVDSFSVQETLVFITEHG